MVSILFYVYGIPTRHTYIKYTDLIICIYEDLNILGMPIGFPEGQSMCNIVLGPIGLSVELVFTF